MSFEVTCTGMAKGTPPDPCMMVIFGASGDLAHSTLMPSLYALSCRGLLPEQFAITGFARREWDDEAFREEMCEIVKNKGTFHANVWEQFARGLSYVHGDVSSSPAEAYTVLRGKIDKVRAERRLPGNILFHCSTPRLYGEIVQKLAAASLLEGDDGWRRMVIKKPFGHDEASARALDRQLLTVITEEQLYRVDHYLGKETVQNLLVFRFTNSGFEPIWNRAYIDNRTYIDHVQITAAKGEGIGTRAGYYDKTGVVRDMIQNHLLQLSCMTAMEPPVSYDGTSLVTGPSKSYRPYDPWTGVWTGCWPVRGGGGEYYRGRESRLQGVF